ncbi:MAG TPA: MerR family DNA-binding transcriptional regulator [Pseudonocardia sp.]|nr:MerR family DNA-binding transcriptional regulator [Pseudonocardia sp.]
MPKKRLVTTGEAAAALGVSLRALQQWRQAGLVLPDVVTPGGHARWDVDRLRWELRDKRRRDGDGDEDESEGRGEA